MSLSPAPLSLLIKAAPILTEEMYGDIQPAAWELLLSVDEHMAGAAGKRVTSQCCTEWYMLEDSMVYYSNSSLILSWYFVPCIRKVIPLDILCNPICSLCIHPEIFSLPAFDAMRFLCFFLQNAFHRENLFQVEYSTVAAMCYQIYSYYSQNIYAKDQPTMLPSHIPPFLLLNCKMPMSLSCKDTS